MIPEGYESASEQIRALFGGEVSDSLRAEIAEAYAALGEDVAGRRPLFGDRGGSPGGELRRAAGHLPPTSAGLEDLLVAVRECWASLWTARADGLPGASGDRSGYRSASPSWFNRWSTPRPLGCMFTANPSNGRRDESR